MSKPRVLVVEDDAGAREALVQILADEGFAAIEAPDLASARATLAKAPVDAMLLDLRLPDGDGQTLLDDLASRRVLPPTIVMTAFGSGSRAINAIRAGAEDYLQKPIDVIELLAMLRGVIERTKRIGAAFTFKPGDRDDEAMVGSGPAMQDVFKRIGRVAQSDAAILIQGESGTGKELVARAIHRHSARSAGTFIAVNCAAVPETLLEAELFGSEKGAFTGAHAQRIGRFEAAGGGTLFLDEIGELSIPMQVKLLRVLQEHTFERLGGNATISTNARIVAASNRDLAAAVANGGFREDLFYRLSVVVIRLPPLRDRREDIAELTGTILRRAARRLERPITLSPEALETLRARDWPGNVRELENELERAILFSGGRIDVDVLGPAAAG